VVGADGAARRVAAATTDASPAARTARGLDVLGCPFMAEDCPIGDPAAIETLNRPRELSRLGTAARCGAPALGSREEILAS
jgi:hypothetical protein